MNESELLREFNQLSIDPSGYTTIFDIGLASAGWNDPFTGVNGSFPNADPDETAIWWIKLNADGSIRVSITRYKLTMNSIDGKPINGEPTNPFFDVNFTIPACVKPTPAMLVALIVAYAPLMSARVDD